VDSDSSAAGHGNRPGQGGASGAGAAAGSSGSGGRAGSAGSGGNSGNAATGGEPGAGAGGTGVVDASSDTCACPDADYQLTLSGVSVLRYNKPSPLSVCTGNAPLRGFGIATCGGVSLELSACAGPNGELPCVSISSTSIEYVDVYGNVHEGSVETSVHSDMEGMLFGTYAGVVTVRGFPTFRENVGGEIVACGPLTSTLPPC
jgi:hypothetical protein